jgi:signal transduction histidine kinase/DNA-binding response OmpR family regulator
MKIRTKLTVLLLVSFLIVICLSVILIGHIGEENQKSNPDFPKSQSLRENARLIDESAKTRENEQGLLSITFSLIIIGITLIMIAGLVFSRKRTRKLADVVEQLKREIEERKRIESEYRAARTEAELANRTKSQFLANMSHEIRTPMNAVIGMAELVLGTELTIEQEEYIATMKTSAESLLGLLNDILDLSKIEMGKLDIEPVEFDFRECLNEIAKNLFIHVQRKKIELIYDIGLDIPKILWGDPCRLRQILTNLIGNAVKFTEKGIILLKTTIQERKPGTRETRDQLVLHFSISDTGIGIPGDKLELIFEKFTQSDSSITRRFGGSGLGLAISRQLVQLMGGNLWVQSPGELKDMKNAAPGSTFHFTLSFGVPGQKVREMGEPVDIKMLKGTPALVVDDNPINRKIFKEMLERWGLKPQMADSGLKAVKMLKQAAAGNNKFQLILMDIQMPGMDGFETVRRIRNDEAIKDSPVIVVTSAGVKGDGRRCRDLGIAAYLRKPVPFTEMLETLLIVMGSVARKNKDFKLITRYSLRESRKKINILVVEDNLINQKLIVRILQKRGYLVDTANDGKEAVEKLSHNSYDLVLMDIQMPKMDGIEATESIRKKEKEENAKMTPIIALTAYAMKGDKERFLKAGMNSYISKPIKQDQLMETIEKLFYENQGE